MEKIPTIMVPKFEDIKGDLNLIQKMSDIFNSLVLDLLNQKDQVNVLDYGSGDLKLSSLLSRGFTSNPPKNKKMKYFCYDPIYYDQNKKEQYKKTSRIILLSDDFVDLEISQSVSDAKKQKTDILISNFCFHHFLENSTEEELKKEIIEINPNKIIICEYNIDKDISIEDFKTIFGKSQQEREEVISSNHDWEHLKDIHTKYDAKYFVSLFGSLGYVLVNAERSKTKVFLQLEKNKN